MEPARTSSVGVADSGLASAINTRVNAYRRARGKPELQRHPGLDRLARQHAESMLLQRGGSGKAGAAMINHTGFEERSLHARRLMGMNDTGENVGTCGGATGTAAETLVRAWTSSAGHRMNLNGAWSSTGIGVATGSDGRVFAVQLFGTEERSHLGMVNRMRSY